MIHLDEMHGLFQLFEVPDDALEEAAEEIKTGQSKVAWVPYFTLGGKEVLLLYKRVHNM